jgi:hypothetical protein
LCIDLDPRPYRAANVRNDRRGAYLECVNDIVKELVEVRGQRCALQGPLGPARVTVVPCAPLCGAGLRQGPHCEYHEGTQQCSEGASTAQHPQGAGPAPVWVGLWKGGFWLTHAWSGVAVRIGRAMAVLACMAQGRGECSGRFEGRWVRAGSRDWGGVGKVVWVFEKCRTCP